VLYIYFETTHSKSGLRGVFHSCTSGAPMENSPTRIRGGTPSEGVPPNYPSINLSCMLPPPRQFFLSIDQFCFYFMGCSSQTAPLRQDSMLKSTSEGARAGRRSFPLLSLGNCAYIDTVSCRRCIGCLPVLIIAQALRL